MKQLRFENCEVRVWTKECAPATMIRCLLAVNHCKKDKNKAMFGADCLVEPELKYIPDIKG